MPIQYEIEIDLPDLMSKLGCNPVLIKTAIDNQLKVEYTADGVTVIAWGQGTYKALASIKLGVLQQILMGTLGTGAANNLIRIQMEKAVKQVCDKAGISISTPSFLKKSTETAAGSTVGYAHKDYVGPTEIDKYGLSSEVVTPTEEVKPLSDNIFMKPIADPKAATKLADETAVPVLGKCPLSQATQLLQPVKGSDPDSTYFLVATSPTLKVGVRIKGNHKLSLRAEGDLLKWGIHLKQAGFVLSGDSHYSLHIDALSAQLCKKTVGAMIYGIGCPFDGVAVNLEMIWNQGT